MTQLMSTSDEVAEYWRGVADGAHEWAMFLYQLRRDIRRARDEFKMSWLECFDHLDRLNDAQDVFLAEYHMALACRHLSGSTYSIEEFVWEFRRKHC